VSPLAPIDYDLPPECVAQTPAEPRDGARLLVLERATGELHHAHVRDLPSWLSAGDLLVRNTTRVLAARLRGRKATGGAAEALLLGPAAGARQVRALLRCGGRLRPGLKLHFTGAGLALDAEVTELDPADGSVTLAFSDGPDPYALGETPLPPYIRREAPRAEDAERYQTVYAQVPGSVAAPTAGLHFTVALLDALAKAGVATEDVVLHVGPGTFRPLRECDLVRGELHAEWCELPDRCAAAAAAARSRGGRVIAVGTTTTRVLESRVANDGTLSPGSGETRLLLGPGSEFRAIDALLTNFHLPRSSLLLLVAGFAGTEKILAAYAEAIRRGYRFYSYGDAMLIV
jgi:S-adenosylmethionine:tRNA ribosyltransferase-isomerase